MTCYIFCSLLLVLLLKFVMFVVVVAMVDDMVVCSWCIYIYIYVNILRYKVEVCDHVTKFIYMMLF